MTKAGRALDKHGGRPGSAFPKAKGTPADKNAQGQFELDDILTDPDSYMIIDYERGGYKLYASDGRGVYYRSDSAFRGFLERRYE